MNAKLWKFLAENLHYYFRFEDFFYGLIFVLGTTEIYPKVKNFSFKNFYVMHFYRNTEMYFISFMNKKKSSICETLLCYRISIEVFS